MKAITYDIDKVISDLREYLETNKMTYVAFAEKSGIDISVISKMMRKVQWPSDNVITKIACCIGKDVDTYYQANTYFLNAKNVPLQKKIEQMSLEEIDELLILLKDAKRHIMEREIESKKHELSDLQKQYEQLLEEESC